MLFNLGFHAEPSVLEDHKVDPGVELELDPGVELELDPEVDQGVDPGGNLEVDPGRMPM